MSEFGALQEKIRGAREDREAARKTVRRSKERLKKLDREKQKVRRSHGKDSRAHEEVLDRERELKTVLTGAARRFAEGGRTEAALLETFARFTDPRAQVAHLSDDYPILLFPLRLETRFKKVPAAGGGVQHQLWVRIFPDDCSIDTFDDTLSETELTKAQNYWVSLWKAGKAGNEDVKPFVRDRQRGAWRNLMGIFNPGRAHWIRESYQPLNANEIPERQSATDTILVIPTEALPDPAIKEALQIYWKAVFLAGGERDPIETAFSELVAATGGGEKDALRWLERYRPRNIETEAMESGAPPPAVQVVFLLFPPSEDMDTRPVSWSEAARVTTLPERFVLLGYQEGNPEPVLEELLAPVPDPLVVGPDPGEDINEVLKAAFGEAFDELTEDEKAEKYIEYLSGRSETKWLFDFDEAIRVGMGLKADLSEAVYNQGLSRLFVLGVKLSADKGEGQSLLERLIRNHHFGLSGFSILPQGTPTNNTDDARSGFSEAEDADDAYDRYHASDGPEDPPEESVRRDGRWLADLLGIDVERSALHLTAGYDQPDQCEARAMNTVLWNATLGYFMESMLTPVFNDRQREATRWFFTHHVRGRGRLPAIRIGDQPYGILPVTTVSKMEWLFERDRGRLGRETSSYLPILKGIYSVLLRIREDWRDLLDGVAHVGKGGDPHAILLKALGLHAASVELDQRYAESFQHIFNKLKLQGVAGEILAALIEGGYRNMGMDLLQELGYDHDEISNPKVPILEKFFLTRGNDVKKPLIDDRELSETETIRAYTASGGNYIEWLIENARNNHQNIRDQKGLTEIPNALLYDMLRHAVDLAFSDTGLKLYRNAEILTDDQAAAACVDEDFIGIRKPSARPESRWDLLYRPEDRIAGNGVLLVQHISSLLETGVVNSQTRHLHEVVSALEILKDSPTARLERAFMEHLDLCSYRLDAWLLGFVDLQLRAMRYGGESGTEASRKGIYLGAYGCLEDVRPEHKELAPVSLPADLKDLFDPTGDDPPLVDGTNAGYVHAPSVDHGITAAVLRNAYISTASPDEAEPYKVNLSSERVRLALSMIEGIQQGQSLEALLGYQLERGLHDRTDQELDIYIYELRKVFPLRANRMLSTAIQSGRTAGSPEEAERFQEEEDELTQDKAVTKIEARNVVNGLALLEHIRKTGVDTYPFGFPTGEGPGRLKSADTGQRRAIDGEVRRLMNIRDAVADLAIAESVHQVVQGNYDRAAAALDSYSKGSYPQMPDVVRTPGSGLSLAHRFAVHLPSDVVAAAGHTPRAQAEPHVDQWLEDLFPDPSEIGCIVRYRIPDEGDGGPGPVVEKKVFMADLHLRPIDLLYMVDVEQDKSLTALDDHIMRFVHASDAPRPDVEVQIQHTRPIDGKVTFFELAPLVESLRSLVVSSRPLLPSDMALQNEATDSLNVTSTLPLGPIQDAKQAVDDIVTGLENDVVNVLSPFIDDVDFTVTLGNKSAIIARIDAVLDDFIDHQLALSLFGIPQSGFGFVYDRKGAVYRAASRKVVEYRTRWLEKQAAFEDLVDSQFPAASTDDERISILQEAERTISTDLTTPVPAIPALQAILAAKKSAFDAKLNEFQAFSSASFVKLQDLVAALDDLRAGLDAFDVVTLETADEERQILVLAENLTRQVRKTATALREKTAAVQALLDESWAAAAPREKVKKATEAAKAIFGEDFQVVPEFTLSEEQGHELERCVNDESQILKHQREVLSNDFPVDDWLYGVARAREKLGAWENAVMLAEAFKDREPLDLTPLQLPYIENDTWLGLSYPPDTEIESDKLLYTCYLPSFDPREPQCGLLVDEWTEVIPSKRETTAISFHYDRPNSEPPQSLLLVTPSAFTGSWKWADIVGALKETLDLARLRTVEPDQIDGTVYARFLPATVAAVAAHPVTMALNYALRETETFDVIGGGDA